MEVYNKKQEKVNKKKMKELKKKGIIAAEKARKKEKVYKSPKAKAERKKKEKLVKHNNELKAKVAEGYNKQTQKWGQQYGGVNAQGDGQLSQESQKEKKEHMLNAEKQLGKINKRYASEKHAKQRLFKKSHSKSCEAMDAKTYTTCHTITEKAGFECKNLLSKANSAFKQYM